jgi:serine/threonine-protein kinase RsbW
MNMEYNDMQARKLFDRHLDSTFECVDEAESAAGLAAKQLGFGEVNQDRIRLAIREAMVNAVAHGNHFDRSKKVRLEIWEDPQAALAVEIVDEGAGFEEMRVPDPIEPAGLARTSGRGLFLIRAFMDEVEINRHGPSGTRVYMVKYRRNRLAGAPDPSHP